MNLTVTLFDRGSSGGPCVLCADKTSGQRLRGRRARIEAEWLGNVFLPCAESMMPGIIEATRQVRFA